MLTSHLASVADDNENKVESGQEKQNSDNHRESRFLSKRCRVDKCARKCASVCASGSAENGRFSASLGLLNLEPLDAEKDCESHRKQSVDNVKMSKGKNSESSAMADSKVSQNKHRKQHQRPEIENPFHERDRVASQKGRQSIKARGLVQNAKRHNNVCTQLQRQEEKEFLTISTILESENRAGHLLEEKETTLWKTSPENGKCGAQKDA